MQVRQITQISEAHCGAAVLQMLLETAGVITSQPVIVEASGVGDKLEEHGMRVDQLALASNRIAPHLVFWYKYYSSLEDMKYLLRRGIPIGVEWQGLFYDSIEEEEREGREDAEYGHYSVVAFFDEELQQVVIVDPYRYFVNRNRVFDADTFLKRWWDTNEVTDPRTGRSQIVEDIRVLFFVTQSDVEIPQEMGFKEFNIIEDGEKSY